MLSIQNRFYFKDIIPKSRTQKVLKVLALGTVALTLLFSSMPETSHIPAESGMDSKYVKYVQSSNPSISFKDAYTISSSVLNWSKEFKLDPKLILAVAKVESGFNKHAISSSGAYGIMQVIPLWHKDKIISARKELGNPEVFNIKTNIYLGAWVLRECKDRTSNLNKALLCYSGQTPGYDKKVLQEYRQI